MKNHPISRIGFRGDRISILTHDHKHSHECTCVCHIVKINHHSHQPNLFSDFAANFFRLSKHSAEMGHLGTNDKKKDVNISSNDQQLTTKKMVRKLLESKGTRVRQLHSKTSNLKQMSSPCVKKVTFKVALAVNCPSSSPLTISTTTYVIIATYMVHHLDQPCAWCTPCLSFLANLPAGRAVWPSNRRDPKFLQQSTVFGICVLIQQS